MIKCRKHVAIFSGSLQWEGFGGIYNYEIELPYHGDITKFYDVYEFLQEDKTVLGLDGVGIPLNADVTMDFSAVCIVCDAELEFRLTAMRVLNPDEDLIDEQISSQSLQRLHLLSVESAIFVVCFAKKLAMWLENNKDLIGYETLMKLPEYRPKIYP